MTQIVSLWPFSCNVYQQVDVDHLSIRLQDQQGVNIPLLLFCCWAGQHYGELSDQQCDKAQHLTTLWGAQAITPLRHIRRQMKLSQQAQSLLSQTELLRWHKIREGVKAIELQAEQGLLEGLQALLEPQTPISLSTNHQLITIIHNIRACFPMLFQDNIHQDLLCWLHAVFPHIAYDSWLDKV